MNELLKLNRLQVFPSEANFITVRVPDANELFETLKQNRILIKNCMAVIRFWISVSA